MKTLKLFLLASTIVLFSLISSCSSSSTGRGNTFITLPDVDNLTISEPEEGGKLILNWTNPTNNNVTAIIIVRKTAQEPTNIDDGEKIFEGTSTSYTDTNLVNGTKYFYLVVTTDGKGHFSKGVIIYGIPQDKLPPSDVSNFQATSKQDGSIKLSWENPADSDFAGVKIVRKAGSAPSSLSDGNEIYNGKDTLFIDTATENGIKYFYMIASYDQSKNYSAGIVKNATSVDIIPPSPVTYATIKVIPAGNKLEISWQIPGDSDFNGVKILRGLNGYCPTTTTDSSTGVTEIGNFPSNAPSFVTDTGLTDGTEYCYSIFAYDEVPNFSAPFQVKGTPYDTLPPAKVYGLNVTIVPEGNSLKISWNEPSDTDYKGVKILRGDGYCPQVVTDTVAISVGDFLKGTAYFEDSGLKDDTKYCYSFFTYDEVPNYSDPATITGTPHDSVPPTAVTKGKVLPSLNGNIIMWKKPDNLDDLQGYLIIAKEWSYPSNPSDGRVIPTSYGEVIGNWIKVLDSEANKETQTYYAIYTYDEVPNYSSPWHGKAGLTLTAEPKMGITGNLNQIVGLKNTRWIISSSYQWTNGVIVADMESPDTPSKLIEDSVSAFSAFSTDKNILIAYTSLYKSPGINIVTYDGSTITTPRNLVSYFKDEALQLSALAGLYDGVRNAYVYYAKLIASNDNDTYYFYEINIDPSNGKNLGTNQIFTIKFNYDIHLFDIKAKWNSTLNRPELLIYFSDPDSGMGSIYWAYKDQDRWTTVAVEDPATNGGIPIGFTGFNINSKGDTYIYYKKNFNPGNNKELRGVLKIYQGSNPYSSMISFGTEYSIEGLYYNDSSILFDSSDNWYILTYKNGENCATGDIEEIFEQNSRPVTVTIENYPTNKSPDYPCLGRRQISGTIITNGTEESIYTTAWNNSLYLYNGKAGDETATFNKTLAGQDAGHYWQLLPLETNGGIDLINVKDSYYFISSGFNDSENSIKGIISPLSASDLLHEIGSYHIYDTANYTARGIFVLANDGSGNLILLYSDDSGATWKKYSVEAYAMPLNGAILVLPDTSSTTQNAIYIAYINNSNNIRYCYGESPLYNFTCTSKENGVESDWVDINLINQSTPVMLYVKNNGTNLDLKTWDPKRGIIKITSGEIGGNKLIITKNSSGYDQLGILFFNNNKLYEIKDITTNNITELTPCSFSYAPANPVKSPPPQITNSGTIVFYIGEPQNLYYGVYLKDQGCWLFNISIGLNASSGEIYPRLDTLIEKDISSLKLGYPSMPIFRDTGTNFVIDFIYTE